MQDQALVPKEISIQIKPNAPCFYLDEQFLRGKVYLSLIGVDLPLLSHLQISLEGRETFIFQSAAPQQRNLIQNQTKFYQSETVVLAQFQEGGLKQGDHVFDFQIQFQDENAKRPPSFNLNEDTQSEPNAGGLGKGFLTLQCRYELKLRGFARINNQQISLIRHEMIVFMVKPELVDQFSLRQDFIEVAKAEVLMQQPSLNSVLPKTSTPQLISAGVSQFSIEAKSDSYYQNQAIPLEILINNKFCKQPVQSLQIKIFRCIKFRLDLGSGQECLCKSIIAVQTIPTSADTQISAYDRSRFQIEMIPVQAIAQNELLIKKVSNLEITRLDELLCEMQIVPTCQSQNFLVYYTLEATLTHNKFTQPIKIEFEIHLGISVTDLVSLIRQLSSF